jgi:CheY-like chemotaxis protein
MSRHRILIVDDDDDVRKVMSTALSTRYEVVQARDGLEALHKLEDYQPDFAIVDAMMPLMDGYQLCEAVRRHASFKAIPVLFLSAYGSKENIKRGYAAGANLFMTKPIDPLRVLKNVEFTIKHERSDVRKKRFSLQELREREGWGEPRRRGGSPNGQGQPEGSKAEVQAAPPPQPEMEGTNPLKDASRAYPSPPPQPAPPPPQQVKVGTLMDYEGLESEEDLEFDSTSVGAEKASPPTGQYAPVYSRPPRGPVARIMIVDKDDDIREMIDVALRTRYEVTTARDGVEAIENIVMYQPDMLIVDIMMPKMNGYQLIQTMRRNVAYQKLPVVVVSGKSTPRDQAYVKKLGADAFIPKPFQIEDLVRVVDEFATADDFEIGEKRLPINEIIEREFLKAKERSEEVDQKDRQRKFTELQEVLNEDAKHRRRS